MRNTTANQIELIFIRHGKTPGNEEKRYIGRTDEGLSEKGREELFEKKAPEADYLFSSPMKRCVETAKLLFGEKKTYLIERWKEIDFGTFEGKNYKELTGDPQYQAWIDSNGAVAFPEGESREEFCRRSVEGFREMIEKMMKAQNLSMEKGMEGQKTSMSEEAAMKMQDEGSTSIKQWMESEKATTKAAAVVHGGTIMAVVSSIYGGEYYDYQVANGEAVKLTITADEDEIKILSVERVNL